MNEHAAGGRFDRLRARFPDREFLVRSQGKVRFIRLSSRAQLAAAGVAAALLLAWVATLGALALGPIVSGDGAALRAREARVARAESRLADSRAQLEDKAADLARRQDFIEKMADTYLDELPAGHAAGNGQQSAGTPAKISAALPEAAPLARLEARQLAFVARLTRYADHRAAAAAAAIREVGLNPSTLQHAMDDGTAQGGPLLRLATARDGSLDPRFERLGLSLARMSALERGLAGIPQVLPASLEFISSGFGYRADPFTGTGAFHAGLDFKGPVGAPIYAAAQGRVSFVGQRQGYGNCVEIDHGNGLMTRYAHMSAFRTAVGRAVRSGEVIGAIGSTGRSTGPHLHFEVRIHDRPVNPRPFLEAASHVQQDPSPRDPRAQHPPR